MIALPRRETKRLVAIHGWSGIVLGLLLYAVVLTGTVAVFATEIGVWSAGAIETRSPFTGPVDATVRKLIAATPARYRDEVGLYATTTNELAAFIHTHETVGGASVERGILWHADRAGRVTQRREGTDDEVFGPDNDSALGRFLVDLHVRLHLPNPWGLLLTGILGLAMLLAVVSGVMIHRHLFKDIFTLRRDAATGLAARDRHNVAGTWSLPFAFIIAFTGSFFSFTGSVGLPALAMVAFGGDQRVMLETLVGTPSAVDPRGAPAASLDRIIADATRRAGNAPNYVSIGHAGRADATVTTNHEPRPGELEASSLVYSGASGAFRSEKPIIGTRPSLGGHLYALMAPLHFGNFAGLASKSVWCGLGFATCYVVITGITLWLRRRGGEQPSLNRLERLTHVVGFGLPLGLAGSGLGFLLARPDGSAAYWTTAAFLVAAAVAICGGLLVGDATRLRGLLRGTTGVMLVALPCVRFAMGGPGWTEALAAGQPLLIGVDLGLALAGFAMLGGWRRRATPRTASRLAAAE